MNRIVTGCTAAVVLTLGGAIAAQTPGSTPNRDQAAQTTITVTGCLHSEQGATGTSGTAGAAANAGTFKLMNASIGTGASATDKAAAGTAKSGTTGAGTTTSAGATTSAAKGTTYVLEGQAAELKKHVNHQVSITGKLASPASAAAGAKGTAGTTGATASGSATMSGTDAKLNVESVKMISATCSM